jgi:hypothetical protein
MSRYYFNLKHPDWIFVDEEGVELPGSKAALKECGRLVREVLMDELDGEAIGPGAEFHIKNGRGRTLMVVPFEERPTRRRASAETRRAI